MRGDKLSKSVVTLLCAWIPHESSSSILRRTFSDKMYTQSPSYVRVLLVRVSKVWFLK